MVWEVVGESAAGKTQLALQLSLLVQIPPEEGGMSGSACYLTTGSKLPTTRLVEIIENHPRLSPALCSLSDIHTIKTPEIPILVQVLARKLPTLIEELAARHGKPIKLLVIDALNELFHSHDKMTGDTLYQRSKSLTEISTLLHSIASTYRVAVLVLNEVVAAIERHSDTDIGDTSDLVYREQVRWFSRAESIPGEGRKQASLGLVWANQVNTRIMLSRTERRRHLDESDGRRAKRRRLDDSHSHISLEDQLIRIRRLSIIFSSVSTPTSMDYIVTNGGVSTLPDSIDADPVPSLPTVHPRPLGISTEKTIDVDKGADLPSAIIEAENGPDIGDDDDEYWRELDLQGDLYGTVDLSSSAPSSSL